MSTTADFNLNFFMEKSSGKRLYFWEKLILQRIILVLLNKVRKRDFYYKQKKLSKISGIIFYRSDMIER